MSSAETRLDKYDNSWFNPGAGVIKRSLWYISNLVFIRNRFSLFMALKRGVLRLFGARIGKGVVIKPGVNIKYPWNLEVGDYTWIGEGVWIDNLAKVKIGSHVCLSQGAVVITGNHDYSKKTFDLIVKEIVINNGAWIGAKTVLCPGVICGEHSVLTVGSIATKNLDPFTIYRGNPAEQVKERSIDE